MLDPLASVAALGPAALDGLRGILGVVLGVGALIFFHELGHFLAAKWAGVRVEVFSLGFGNRLVGFRHGDTDYRISALPLGGYVRMLGQADEDPLQPKTDLEDDFRNKPVYKRFIILVAGVVMNILLAALGFMVAFGLGIDFTAAQIGSIEPGSPAARADLRPGDIVTHIDGDEVLGWQDLQTLVAIADQPLELTVRRDGATHTTSVTPFRTERDTYARIGVAPSLVLSDLPEDSPLHQAGARGPTDTTTDTLLNIAPVSSRDDPDRLTARMDAYDLAEAVEQAQGTVLATVIRTTYGDDRLPTASETLTLEVEVQRKPEYTIGLQIPDHAYIQGVTPDGPADRAGLLPGDRITQIGDHADITLSNLVDRVRDAGAAHPDQPIPVHVIRQGEPHQLDVQLDLENPEQLEAALADVDDPQAAQDIRRSVGRYLLGIRFRANVVGEPSTLSLADPDAEPITLPPGTRIHSVWLDGGLWWSQELQFLSLTALRQILRERGDEPFKLTWYPPGDDPDQVPPHEAIVQAKQSDDLSYGDLGIRNTFRQTKIQRGPLPAVTLGAYETLIQTQRIALMLRSFITGAVSPKELGGPIQIVNIVHTVAARDSLAKFFHLLAILSVNLAVINILPIPVLDGGHIMFLLLEKLKGRPVSPEIMIYTQYAGLLCILGLMALVFFNDISRLFQ